MTDSSSYAFVMPEGFRVCKFKCEFLIVPLSFPFSPEAPLPCSYRSGDILLFIRETSKDFAGIRIRFLSIWSPRNHLTDTVSYFQKTGDYWFAKATMFLDIFIWTCAEIRTKEERAVISQGLEWPLNSLFIHSWFIYTPPTFRMTLPWLLRLFNSLWKSQQN